MEYGIFVQLFSLLSLVQLHDLYSLGHWGSGQLKPYDIADLELGNFRRADDDDLILFIRLIPDRDLVVRLVYGYDRAYDVHHTSLLRHHRSIL